MKYFSKFISDFFVRKISCRKHASAWPCLFFLNFNYDSFNYLFLPACCVPHAGLGIKQFFFTICQENFRICQENRGISGSVQKNFQIYLRFLIANFRILTYRHLATYRKQTKKNTRLQVVLTSKFCLI